METKDLLHNAMKTLQEELPAVFAGTELDRITGNAYRWDTLRNEIYRGEAPADICYTIGSRKKIVDRDRFIEYLATRISVE